MTNTAFSAEQADRLFWLGRYTERTVATLRSLNQLLDTMIDEDPKAYVDFCQRLAIPSDIYRDAADFEARYLTDAENPDSVLSNLSRAYDNALVLRSFISSETLSYIQLALTDLSEDAEGHGAYLKSQDVIDRLLAFWGSLEESPIAPERRALILSGKYTELADLALRLAYPDEMVRAAVTRLSLYRGRLKPDADLKTKLAALTALVSGKITEDVRERALTLVNSL